VVRSIAALALAWSLVGTTAADVVLDGVSDAQAANIKAFLGLADLGCDAPSWLVRWQARQADAQIATSLEALGFYGARVEGALEFPADSCWQARFRIVPGDPVIVRAVDVTVDHPLAAEASIAALIQRARSFVGTTLNHAQYEDLKRHLLAAAQSLGYFDASFEISRVRVDAQAHSAAVTLDLAGGSRFTFGDIEIVGDFLERRLIDAYIPFRTGEPYDAALVARLRRNLADSGYFGRTFVTADRDTAVAQAIPIRIELFPRSRAWTYAFGLGYATDTGPRIRADATNDLLNPRGHRASVKSVLSTDQSSLDLQYRMPHRSPLNDWFIFDAGIAHLDSTTSTSDVKRIGARHTYERGEWVQTDFVDLTHEDFKVADQFGQSRLLLFGTTWSRFRRDQPTRPTDGFRIDTTLRGASQSLGSDTDFVQVLATGRIIERLTERTRVLVRTTGGWTWKDEFSDLPPSIRFFAGGGASIRGYAFQGVGPERDGNVVGGRALLTGSLEFDYQFRTDWAAAAFVDSGSAFDDEPHFVTGVGVGIRWFSPVGPIRVDVAHPLDDPTTQWRLSVRWGRTCETPVVAATGTGCDCRRWLRGSCEQRGGLALARRTRRRGVGRLDRSVGSQWHPVEWHAGRDTADPRGRHGDRSEGDGVRTGVGRVAGAQWTGSRAVERRIASGCIGQPGSAVRDCSDAATASIRAGRTAAGRCAHRTDRRAG
jgi:translocation and assembly module TamA